MNIKKFAVDGMTCHSCELIIEKRWKSLPGVRKVEADSKHGTASIACDGEAPTLEELNAAIEKDGYRIHQPSAVSHQPSVGGRPSFWQLVGLFALVLLLGRVVSRLGWLQSGFSVDATTGFWTVFAVGLLAAASSCVAVIGGLVVSLVAKTGKSAAPWFVLGRIASYGLFGGLIGAVGGAFSPSPTTLGAITVLAALYMFTAGLGMLNLTPAWLKGLLPKMPKGIARRLFDADGGAHPPGSFLMGAATFFVPCGFTQSLQIYALTTGSFERGALILTAFALGTAPALLALGWASSSLKGSAGTFFFRFSGALVIVLGLWNVQNGLTLAGISFQPSAVSNAQAAEDPNVMVENGVQVIRMRMSYDPAYLPSDTYTVKAGTPVRLEVAGPGTGCRGILQIPKLGVSLALLQAKNVTEFTPKKPGSYVFSCAMGMFPGMLNVVKS